MEILFFAIIFVLIAPAILYTIITTYKNHYKSTGGVINYDSAMRKLVYKVSMTKQEIIETLKAKNVADELSCVFDLERSTVVFSEYDSSREYYFYIQEYDGFSILKLEQSAVIVMRSYVPYKLNPFLTGKLQAEAVPFSQYSF